MRLVYVGNFGPTWSTENHVALAAESLGAEVVRVQESGLDWATLPGLCDGADLMLWTRTAGFDPGDLAGQAEAVARVSCPKVGFHLDRWWGLNREPDVRRSPWFRLDWLFTAHDAPEWAGLGVRHVWSPPAVLTAEAKLGRRSPGFPDVVFVGNLSRYGHAEWAGWRRSIFDRLTSRYGRRFRELPGPGRPQIRGAALAEVYASARVVVGDSCLAGDVSRYWSDRIPETLGRGGRLIHPWVSGMEGWFTDQAFGQYPAGDLDGLVRLVDRALEGWDPAPTGRAEVLRRHTYEDRLLVVAETLGLTL